MRDRLIELLRDTFNYTKGVCIDFDEAVEINADHLLAEGVIVLPCKVGQTVYRMNIFNSAYREATVVAIYYTEDKKYYPKPHILAQHPDTRGRIRIDFRDIGKTVFLTQEEAEKALERIENGKS